VDDFANYFLNGEYVLVISGALFAAYRRNLAPRFRLRFIPAPLILRCVVAAMALITAASSFHGYRTFAAWNLSLPQTVSDGYRQSAAGCRKTPQCELDRRPYSQEFSVIMWVSGCLNSRYYSSKCSQPLNPLVGECLDVRTRTLPLLVAIEHYT